jgi:hypothetical protein
MVRLRGHDTWVPLWMGGHSRAELMALLALDDDRIGAAYTISPNALRRRDGLRELRRVMHFLHADTHLAEEFRDLIEVSAQLHSKPSYRLAASRRAFIQAFGEYRTALLATYGTADLNGDVGILQYAIRELERLGEAKEPTLEVRLVMKADDADELRRLAFANGISPGQMVIRLMKLRQIQIDAHGDDSPEPTLMELGIHRDPSPPSSEPIDTSQLPGGAT